MKRLTAFFTIIVLAFTLTACAEPKTAAELVQAAEGHTVYNGNGFAFSYDPAVWNDISSMLDSSNEFMDEQISNMSSGAFSHVEDQVSNFNIMVNNGGHSGKKLDYDKVAEQMETEYAQMSGITFKGYTVTNINGYEYMKFAVEVDVPGLKLDIDQYAYFTKTKNYVITFTEFGDAGSQAKADFEKALATFVYDEE